MIQNNDRKAAKAGLWYTIVNFLSKGAVFLITPFFTRIMTTDEVGAYSNVTSWLSILLPLVTIDMSASLVVARFDYKDEFNKYCSSAMLYGSLIATGVYLLVLANMKLVSSVLSISPICIHIMFIYIITFPAFTFFQTESMYLYRYRASAIITLSSLVLSIGLALLFAVNSTDKVAGRAFGDLGVYSIFSIVLYIFLLIKGKGVSFKYFKYAFKISFPIVWHNLSMHLLSSGDRIVIVKYLGESDNALYTIAYMCAHVVSVLYHSLNSAWSPWSTAQMHDGNIEKLKKASRIYVIVFAVFTCGLILICPDLLLLFGGRRYLQAKMVIPPVMVAVVCQFIYTQYITVEFYLKKQVRIPIGTVLAAALNLGLNIYFVPRYGYVAAAYTTLFGYFCLFIFHFISVKQLGKGNWYDEKCNFAVLGAMLVLIPVFNYLYNHNIARYIIVAIMALVLGFFVIRYRKKIVEIAGILLKKDSEPEKEAADCST